MKAQELAIQAKKAKPLVKYGYSTDDTTVGVYDGTRWVAVAGRILTGGFASLPVEILVNGHNPTNDLTFISV